MTAPWQGLAWTVFGACFIGPFLVLLNKKVKTVPAAMIAICSVVIAGIWLEHFLLIGPVLYPHASSLPLNWIDAGVGLGFLGLLVGALTFYLNQFPEILQPQVEEGC
jgi:hypothetical protein